MKCEICEKEIHIEHKIFEGELYTDSEDATSFEDVWFCNECYNKILEGIKIDPIKILHEEE